MNKLKLFLALTLLVVSLGWMGNQLSASPIDYMSVLKLQPAEATPAAPTYPPRTVQTVSWTKTICSNELTKQDHTMHLISREEISAAVDRARFVGDNRNIAIALAYAEGQADLACESDWDLSNSKWGGSIGLWQIRTLTAETGKGTCRDIDALKKLDIDFQARCAYEISGGGINFRPWSAYLNGSYKKYV